MPVFCVMPVVATLTESGEVQEAARFRPVIKYVCRGQHDQAAGDRMRFTVSGGTPLATILGAHDAHEVGTEFPILRIAADIFRAYWHKF